jgi:hypothetical protein
MALRRQDNKPKFNNGDGDRRRRNGRGRNENIWRSRVKNRRKKTGGG